MQERPKFESKLHKLSIKNILLTSQQIQSNSLKRSIEQLECKIEELHKNLAEAQKNLIAEKRKNERLEKERNSEENGVMRVNLRKLELSENESLHDDVVSILYVKYMWEEEVNKLFININEFEPFPL